MEEIVNYIKDTYEFEIVTRTVPTSKFQQIKRIFYIWIMNILKKYESAFKMNSVLWIFSKAILDVSKRLFYFLKDKESTELQKESNDNILLRKRISDNLYEIEVSMVYPTKFNLRNHIYSIRLINDYLWVCDLDELHIEKLDTILVDNHLGQFKELKQFLRNKRLENILNSK